MQPSAVSSTLTESRAVDPVDQVASHTRLRSRLTGAAERLACGASPSVPPDSVPPLWPPRPAGLSGGP